MSKKIFFWTDDEYSSFSNFTPVELEIGGKTYASVEHYYQAAKSDSIEEQEKIRLAKSAYKAKQLAKKNKFLRKDWDSYKLIAMRIALESKFNQPTFRSLLIKSGDALLFEDNPHDVFWGTGEAGGEGTGQNNLGKMLMEIRKEINPKI